MRRRHRQRVEGALDVAPGRQRFSARREQPQPWTGLEELFGEHGACDGQVFAVVQEQKDLAVAEVTEHLVLRGCRRHVPNL